MCTVPPRTNQISAVALTDKAVGLLVGSSPAVDSVCRAGASTKPRVAQYLVAFEGLRKYSAHLYRRLWVFQRHF